MSLSNKQQAINELRANRKFMQTLNEVLVLFDKDEVEQHFQKFESKLEQVNHEIEQVERKFNLDVKNDILFEDLQ